MRNGKTGVGDTIKEVVTPILLYVWLLTTSIAALSGPFGTYEALSFGPRLAYWAVVVGLSIFISVSLRIFWRGAVRAEPAWLEDCLVIGSLAIILGPLIAALNQQLWPDLTNRVGWYGISAMTFLIGIGTVTVRRAIQGAAPVGPTRQDRLLQRLDIPEGARLWRISSDNHHVRVFTADGAEHRLLMRLRDAVMEIDVEPGFYVHRSHWVAEGSIGQVVEKDGREVLELTCGAVVPIGPKYRPALVESGFVSD